MYLYNVSPILLIISVIVDGPPRNSLLITQKNLIFCLMLNHLDFKPETYILLKVLDFYTVFGVISNQFSSTRENERC